MYLPVPILIAFILVLICRQAPAQSVISNYSGLILYFEGAVSLNGEPIQYIHGRFPQLGNGSLLSTTEGRAEILMAPGVLLWLGPHSSIRVENTDLADARIQFLTGSLVMQSSELPAGNAVTLIHNGTEIHAKAHTVYRQNVSSEMDRWARKRAQIIAFQNLRAHRRHKHAHAFSRPYPSAAPSLPGRTFQ